jgi:hypothetical protein
MTWQEWVAATTPFFYFFPHICQVSWLHNLARLEEVRTASCALCGIATGNADTRNCESERTVDMPAAAAVC